MTAKSLLFSTCLAFLFLSSPAMGAQSLSPINENLYYEANYGGLNFGKVGIEIDEQADKASVTCDIISSGILELFVKHSSHTTLTATGENFVYPDRIYESNYQTRKKKRSVKLVYKDGKIIERNIHPPESAEKRPPVPDDDKDSAYDLMSFLLQIRSEIINARKDGKSSFSLNAYDGRRLTQVNFTIGGETAIIMAGKSRPVLTVSASRKQLAGFTQDEIKDYDPDEPSLTTYFSNDEKMLPLHLEVPFLMQKITVSLVKTCGDGESCLLGISN